MTAHRTRVSSGSAGDIAAAWSRLVGDLERVGLLGRPGAWDAVAGVGADVLGRAERADRPPDQLDAP